MRNVINERLEALREEMDREHLWACIIPTADRHSLKRSEFVCVADHWRGCEWISGYNGADGTAVVTMESEALWTTDGFNQSDWELLHSTNSRGSTEVAIDGTCCSVSRVRQLTDELRHEGGLTLRTNLDVLSRVWKDRPPLPSEPVEIEEGESVSSKLQRIRKALRDRHADGMLVADLEDIAWTLNLRGRDSEGKPAFAGYLLISTQNVTLYINKEQGAGLKDYLQAEGIAVDDYANVEKGLKDYFEYNILMDPDEVNYSLFTSIGDKAYKSGREMACRSAVQVVEAPSPVPALRNPNY